MAFGDRAIDYTERKVAGMYALLDNWAGTMVTYARENAPWKDRTAHARQGLHSGVDRDGTKLILYLSHGVEYGAYLEKGTPPHVIRPRGKEAGGKDFLYWPGAPHPVRQVHHPGTKGYPIIGPTFEEHIGRIKKTILDYWSGE